MVKRHMHRQTTRPAQWVGFQVPPDLAALVEALDQEGKIRHVSRSLILREMLLARYEGAVRASGTRRG